MAVLSMKRIEICALQKDKKELLGLLQQRGIVEIISEKAKKHTFKEDTSQKVQSLKKGIATVSKALEAIAPYREDKGGLTASLAGRTRVEKERFEQFNNEALLQKAQAVLEAEHTVAEQRALRTRLYANEAALKGFMQLDVPLQYEGNGKAVYTVGSLPKEYTVTELYEALARVCPQNEIYIEILSVEKMRTCIFALFERKKEKEALDALRAIGFEYPAFENKDTPLAEAAQIKEALENSLQAEENAKKEILEYAAFGKEFEFGADCMQLQLDRLEAQNALSQTEHTVFISGFIPEKYAKGLVEELEGKFTLYATLSEPKKKDKVPVMLENNAFSRPVTGVLNAFGLPGKGEVDPVGIMSIFYYVLFGLMFSDAGYGLLMVLICGFVMLKYKKSDAPIMQSVKMFFWCGVSTAIWGFALGSFFGDALEVISTNFLNTQWTTPTLWMAPIKEPMKMLIFTMAIGIVHMYTGLFLAGYQHIRAKRYADCIYDVVSWFILVTALIFMLMGTTIFEGIAGFRLIYKPWQNYLIYAAALIGALIVILTAGRESKNPFKRILKGLYGLYNVTGWLGDAISYSRLLALGLATGVVGAVVNQMGAMIGNAVAFAVVFVFGHTLNFAINILGAYVHCNRLQFVEFFGKFFEGGGKEFTPLKINTKKYTIMEDK